MGLTNGKCDICGTELTSYMQDEKGTCYCSEKCLESTLPKCQVCKTPMRQWTESEDGRKYCSNECYTTSLPKCRVCNKYMDKWIESESGNRYCSNECYSKTWNKCKVCKKQMDKWFENEDGEKFCSDECFMNSCPVCDVCGKHTDSWIQSEDGKIFCSKECRETQLPQCSICKKKMDEWFVDVDGNKYCSEECHTHVLPKCMHCQTPMKEWIETQDGRIYCSQKCNDESDLLMETVNGICACTGLTGEEVGRLLVNNSWSIEEAAFNIDDYMKSLNGKATVSTSVIEAFKNANVYAKLADNLSTYNTMRGSAKGFKGFVFEELHAADSTLNGIVTEVISNNGAADFQILNPDGSISLGQAKAGYKGVKVDWSKYQGQEIIIDKGNAELIENAKEAGMNVIESNISEGDAASLAKKMQMESKIFGRTNAPITSKLHSYHKSGVNTAKKGAAFGAGLSIGSNLVDLATGEKTLEEAGADIVVDTAVATASSYVIGAGAAAAANTAAGGFVISSAAAAGSAVAGTALGSAAIATTATVTGAATAAGTAIAGTAVGSAVVGAAGSAAAVIGTTAAGAAVVAAAPLVAAGAAVGAVFSIGKKMLAR